MPCVAVCRSALQCVAVRCSVEMKLSLLSEMLLSLCVCCSEWSCSALQCVAVCCSALQCVAVSSTELQCVVVCCSVLQCVAVSCSELQ